MGFRGFQKIRAPGCKKARDGFGKRHWARSKTNHSRIVCFVSPSNRNTNPMPALATVNEPCLTVQTSLLNLRFSFPKH